MTMKRKVSFLAVGAWLLCVVIFLGSALPVAAATIMVGEKAPLFTTRTLDGKTFNLKDDIGKKVILLNFWSVFCRDCLSRIEALNKIHDLFQTRNFELLGIAGDPPTEKMLKKVSHYAARMHYPVILDPDLEIYQSYGVEIIPFAVLIDIDGNVVMAIESLDPGPLKQISDAINRLTKR